MICKSHDDVTANECVALGINGISKVQVVTFIL